MVLTSFDEGLSLGSPDIGVPMLRLKIFEAILKEDPSNHEPFTVVNLHTAKTVPALLDLQYCNRNTNLLQRNPDVFCGIHGFGFAENCVEIEESVYRV